MQLSDKKFELPEKLDGILGWLSSYYSKRKKQNIQKLIVNSKYSVQEEWTYDNWNGGTYGHAIYFQTPVQIYNEVFEYKDDIAEQICKDINKISTVENEYIAKVFIEFQEDDNVLINWREKSGIYNDKTTQRYIDEENISRLWIPGCFRVFLSHKAEYKVEAAQLKDELKFFGVSSFVAHEDIEPTKEWQDEIRNALFSMDAMVPLMTEKFKESYWTDQELGVAIGRGIPIFSIRLGKDPYGFIGRFQALSGYDKNLKVLAKELVDCFLNNSYTKIRMINAMVTCFENADCFDQANTLIRILDNVDLTNPNLIKRLEKAFASNSQVRDAYDVQDILPRLLKKTKIK